MKKSILIAVLLITSFVMNVMAGVDPVCYVTVGEKTYFGQKLSIGPAITTIISEDGTVVKVPTDKVKVCMDGTRYFELLPVVTQDNDTSGYAIMEYITSRNGLKLYRYDNFKNDPASSEFYVFTDERLYLKIDQKNAADVFAFFGVETR